jgi:hypothetical protein
MVTFNYCLETSLPRAVRELRLRLAEPDTYRHVRAFPWSRRRNFPAKRLAESHRRDQWQRRGVRHNWSAPLRESPTVLGKKCDIRHPALTAPGNVNFASALQRIVSSDSRSLVDAGPIPPTLGDDKRPAKPPSAAVFYDQTNYRQLLKPRPKGWGFCLISLHGQHVAKRKRGLCSRPFMQP